MFMKFNGFMVAMSIPLLIASFVVAQEQRSTRVFFGTAGNNCNNTEGIYSASFSPDAARMTPSKLALELKGAGWVTLHPKIPDVIYSTGDFAGQPSVVAVSIKGESAKVLGSQPTGDGGACFLTTDNTGQLLISAHYGGGSISVYPLEANGQIGQRSQLIEHQGASKVVVGRQDAPHPHYVAISPDNRFAFVPDLGLDQLVKYRIDLENLRLVPDKPIAAIPGGGPRHMKFHASGKFAFVLNELALSVTLFGYNSETGTMEQLQTVETLSDVEKAEHDFNSASEIRLNGDSYVYTANRGHDSISVFRFDSGSGALQRIQLVPIHGSWPRNFNLSPDGKFLIAAGQYTNSVSLFAINDGLLKHLENQTIFVPGPICVALPAEK